MNKYVVEFTENQLRTLAKGLEFYSRFLAGQWEIPDELQWKEYKVRNKPENFWSTRNYAEDRLKEAKVVFFGENFSINSSYGIGSPNLSEDARIAYDIYRPVWEELIGKDAENYNVYSHPGLQYSKEGRIKIEVIDEKES